MTPLMVAICEDADEIAQQLISRRARLNDVDKQGNTALHHAVLLHRYVQSIVSLSYLCTHSVCVCLSVCAAPSMCGG